MGKNFKLILPKYLIPLSTMPPVPSHFAPPKRLPGSFGVALGVMAFCTGFLASAHLALRNQHFNQDSLLQREIQRASNRVNHGMNLTDAQLPEEHRGHAKCSGGRDLNYPVLD